MITTKAFKKQIAKTFGQAMRSHGFKGTGLEYSRDTKDFMIAVYFVPGK